MRERIQKILEKLNENAFERQEAIALSLLCALAGESIFLLGLPGVGKSMIARKLKMAFKDAKVFEYLMSRFSTPDEIFGPVSITGLKDNDRYERVTQGYLPEAEVIFLDEIWKAGPAIQNSLLTVLNEKIFLNGNKEMSLPVKAIIAASNELPAEGEGLEALWDRFLIRYIVEPIKNKENFFKLIGSAKEKEENIQTNNRSQCYLPISSQEYEKILTDSYQIEMPQKICDLLFSIREKLNSISKNKMDMNEDPEEETDNFYISDRRWKKAVGILKTSACLNGRKSIDLTDTLLLGHMLWNEDSKIPEVIRIISENIVSTLFTDIIKSYQSKKSQRRSGDCRPFSYDGKNYIIECDDYPLKISRQDYEKLKKKPKEYFFGSETKDGFLFIKDMGQYSLRFVREGVININSFNYNLKSLEDNTTENMISPEEFELKADNLMREFEKGIKENIFIGNSAILESIMISAKFYRERFSKL